MKKIYRNISLACFGTAIVLVCKTVFIYFFPAAASEWKHLFSSFLLTAACFIYMPVILLSEEKRLWLPVWGGIAALCIFGGLFWYRLDSESFFMLFPVLTSVGLFILAVGFLTKKAEKSLLLRGVILAVLPCSLIILCLYQIPVDRLTVSMILFCLLLFIAQEVSRRSVTILYLTPVFLIAVLLITLLPVRQTPMRWNILRKIAASVEETVNNLIVGASYLFSDLQDSYALSFTGYSGKGGLNGSVLAVTDEQITISGSVTRSPLYLTGTIHDTYTGRGWEQRAVKKPYEGDEYALNLQAFTDALAQSIFTEEEIREFIRPCPFRLKFEGIKTKTCFFGTYGSKFSFSGNVKTDASYDSIRMSKARGNGFSYSFVSLDVDWQNEKVKQLLRGQAWNNKPDLSGAMKSREQYIHQEYTRLPGNIPQRVYDLAEVITKGQENDYDRMKAIEQWLNRFAYTTTPPVCPEDQDFTDYFLFEGKEGYCTYFATAMAVLGRAIGIPSRYVEGFVSYDTLKTKIEDVGIAGKDSHAWTEIYLDGIGWILFEPTPGYYEASQKAWKQPDRSFQPKAVKGTKEKPENAGTAAMDENTVSNAPELDGVRLLHGALQAVSIICLILLTTLFLLLIRKRFRKWKYLSKNTPEKMEYLMQFILRIGQLYGFSLEKGETLKSYCTRAEEKMCAGDSLSEICNLYQSMRFGGMNITNEQLGRMEHYILTLKKQYLNSSKRAGKVLFLFRL